jgi:hypothetical protein
MKQVIVGTYECGYEQIELVLREGTGGEFYSCPEKGKIPRIKVGAQKPSEWRLVVSTLMHEIMEFAMWRQDCRYSPDNRITPMSHADYLFVMNHEKFNDCITKVGEFISLSLPDLSAAYAKWHKAGRIK